MIEKHIVPFLPNNVIGKTVSGFIRSFTLGATLRILIYIFSLSISGFKSKEKLHKMVKNSAHIGLWIGAMNGVYRLVKNILNEWRGKERAWHHLVGGRKNK